MFSCLFCIDGLDFSVKMCFVFTSAIFFISSLNSCIIDKFDIDELTAAARSCLIFSLKAERTVFDT